MNLCNSAGTCSCLAIVSLNDEEETFFIAKPTIIVFITRLILFYFLVQSAIYVFSYKMIVIGLLTNKISRLNQAIKLVFCCIVHFIWSLTQSWQEWIYLTRLFLSETPVLWECLRDFELEIKLGFRSQGVSKRTGLSNFYSSSKTELGQWIELSNLVALPKSQY